MPAAPVARNVPIVAARQPAALRNGRFGVVVVLGLLVFAAIRGVSTLTGSGQASGQEPSAVVATSSVPGAASAPSTSAATTSAPPPTEPEETGPPTEDNPAEVLIVGDSDAGTFGPYLEGLLDETGVADVELDYIASTGLSRPDKHNWPRHLRERLATTDPEVVIISFGGNDAQGLTEKCADDAMGCLDTTGVTDVVVGVASDDNAAEWTEEYVRRVQEVLDIVTADPDRRVIWVGIPNAADPVFTARLQIQDEAVTRGAAGLRRRRLRRHVGDLRRAQRQHRRARRRSRDGKAKPVRASDGFHLNVDGAEILAVDIASEVATILEDLGADLLSRLRQRVRLYRAYTLIQTVRRASPPRWWRARSCPALGWAWIRLRPMGR